MSDVDDQVPAPPPVPVRFVLIDPAGTLEVREADGTAEPDDWGDLYQARLWAAVAEAVDPHRRQVTTVALEHNLWLRVVDLPPAPGPQLYRLYPANPTAWAMVTALGGPDGQWRGPVAITGAEDDEGVSASLADHQLALVTDAHRRARRPHR
ncbi:MAG: hypothetical protein HOV94_40345 [Saccharothrix sp.]|nr:hypothetical protein [Saccharothrix sp.]